MSNTTIKNFIERLDMIEDEALGVRLQRAEVYKAAREAGHDPDVLRRLVIESRMDKAKLERRRAIDEQVGQYRMELGL